MIKDKKYIVRFFWIIILSFLLLRQGQVYDLGYIKEYFATNSLDKDSLWKILLILAMMFANWYLESIKWKALVKSYMNVTIKDAIRTIAIGISAGIVTPARIGEYVGRAYSTPNKYRMQALSATLLSSIAQNFWNLLIGATLCIMVLYELIFEELIVNSGLVLILMASLGACFFIYFNISNVLTVIFNLLDRFKMFQNNTKREVLTHLDSYNKIYVLMLSLCRYCVYFFQYVIIIHLLDVELDFVYVCGIISMIFMIQSLIFLPGIVQVMMRGEVAIWAWGLVKVSATKALTATYLLWGINLFIPALIGMVFLFYYKNNPNKTKDLEVVN